MNKTSLLLFALLFLGQNLGAQVDTVPPVLVCKVNPTLGIHPLCFVTIGANDLVDTVYDNSHPIELALRKRCTGSGFPQKSHINFDANDLGDQMVEVWARDNIGNISSCLIKVYIGDGFGSCDPWSSLSFQTILQEGIDSVYFDVKGSNCLFDSVDYQIFVVKPAWMPTFFQGNWSTYGGFVPSAGYEYDITPFKNDKPLNGVTIDDLSLISEHILNIKPLNSPYKIIAADANQDGKVTTFDIVILRKLILKQIDELPNGKSWRFLPYNYVFPNPTNPFNSPFPEKVIVPYTYESPGGSYSFWGIKIGDVNLSADPN